MAHKHPRPCIQPQRSRSRDINILLLGATGTGKTTFINAMANYMSFDTIEQAVRGEMQVLIPSSITFPYGDDQEERTIVIGNPNQFERFDQIGESATQLCRSFVFTIGDRKLRFIDAPGIGDTRGVEQDEKNFQEILSFISQYDHLNALCILLKPNEDRLTVTFKFCVTELLRHLHIDSRRNLIFVYTNARATFYRPGSSGKLLRILFEKYREDCGLEVPLTNENTFIFDNEAFRYLAIRKQDIELDEEQTTSYCKSWAHSVKEMLRFLTYVCSRPPHRVQSIKSLNTAEQLIRKLPRPIAEATRLIEVNVEQAQRYKQRVVQNPALAEQGVPQNLGRIRRLNHPRTVCASEKCRTIVETEDEMRVHYKSVCHDECYLHQVQQETLAHPQLEDCTAINYKTGKASLIPSVHHRLSVSSCRYLRRVWLSLAVASAHHLRVHLQSDSFAISSWYWSRCCRSKYLSARSRSSHKIAARRIRNDSSNLQAIRRVSEEESDASHQ